MIADDYHMLLAAKAEITAEWEYIAALMNFTTGESTVSNTTLFGWEVGNEQDGDS